MTATIDDIESWLGDSLPQAYREFLNRCEVEFIASDLVVLYGRAMFIERNETYETKQYCPEFVTIGNDSGDMELILSLRNQSIWTVDGGSMRAEDAETVADSFSEWLADGCPLPEFEHDPVEWPVDPLERVCIYLEQRPAALRALLMIKQKLGLTTSIAVLKQALDLIPCSILDDVSYASARVRCQQINNEDHCVGIRLASDVSRRLPVEYGADA